MPHNLNIDGITESMFILQSLVHGSRSFCEKHQIIWCEESDRDYDWDYYFAWLKSSLCEHLIKSSITMRMLQDILKDYNQEDLDMNSEQSGATNGLVLGVVHEGKFDLTLREAFNKVIHATDTRLDWKEEESFDWWSGRLWLYGKQRRTEWKLELDVEAFAISTHRLIESLGGSVDWDRLYKYDS